MWDTGMRVREEKRERIRTGWETAGRIINCCDQLRTWRHKYGYSQMEVAI